MSCVKKQENMTNIQRGKKQAKKLSVKSPDFRYNRDIKLTNENIFGDL